MRLPCFDNLRRSPRSDSPRHTQSHNMGIDLVILVISRWGERVGRGNSVILSSRGRLAQRLAQVLYTHKAGGSNPSSPTTELLGLQRWRPFLFRAHFMGFEPISASATKAVVKKWQKSTATLLTTYKKIAFTYVTQHVSIIRTNSWIKIVYSSPFRLAI